MGYLQRECSTIGNPAFDFIYLDARHDYCAVAEDIKCYWPKVRPGGILAGHDFIDAQYAVSIFVFYQFQLLCVFIPLD